MEFGYSFAGLLVGFVIGLTGIGGGALMTPILIVGFGVPLIVAVSTDLLYAAFTKAGGIFNYAKKQLVEWRVAGLLLLGSLPASLVTLILLSEVESLSTLESTINLTLGVSLLLTSIAVFFRERIRRLSDRHSDTAIAQSLAQFRPVLTILCGLFLGGLVTLSSVGAGALGTAMLILLYPRLSMGTIVGTDLVHAVVLTAFSGFGHMQMGTVDLELLAYLLAGSLPGVWLGSRVGANLSPKLMQPIIGSLLMAIGIRFVLAV
jgi:uncharacterized membrane protein YfcA